MRLDYIYVGIQFLLFACLLWLPHDQIFVAPVAIQILGLVICILGSALTIYGGVTLGSSLTALPSPKTGANLKTDGAYRFARHPIYTGILLAFLGYLLFSGDLAVLIVGSGLFLLFYLKVRYEERRLLQHYGQAYAEYMKTVGRFTPRQKR